MDAAKVGNLAGSWMSARQLVLGPLSPAPDRSCAGVKGILGKPACTVVGPPTRTCCQRPWFGFGQAGSKPLDAGWDPVIPRPIDSNLTGRGGQPCGDESQSCHCHFAMHKRSRSQFRLHTSNACWDSLFISGSMAVAGRRRIWMKIWRGSMDPFHRVAGVDQQKHHLEQETERETLAHVGCAVLKKRARRAVVSGGR